MEDIMNKGDNVPSSIAANDVDSPPSTLSSHSFDDSYFDSFPDGYRFTPTDEELVLCYLKKKIDNVPLPPNRIRDEDIYEFNPDALEEKYELHRERERYFFTPTYRKYENGDRPARGAGGGCWKATGTDKTILCPITGKEVGFRKSLVFYSTPKPTKESRTDWIMQEYRLSDTTKRISHKDNKNKITSLPMDHEDLKKKKKDMLDVCVLCKLYKKERTPVTTKLAGKKRKAKCRSESKNQTDTENEVHDQPFGDNTPSSNSQEEFGKEEEEEEAAATFDDGIPTTTNEQQNVVYNFSTTYNDSNYAPSSFFSNVSSMKGGYGTRIGFSSNTFGSFSLDQPSFGNFSSMNGNNGSFRTSLPSNTFDVVTTCSSLPSPEDLHSNDSHPNFSPDQTTVSTHSSTRILLGLRNTPNL